MQRSVSDSSHNQHVQHDGEDDASCWRVFVALKLYHGFPSGIRSAEPLACTSSSLPWSTK